MAVGDPQSHAVYFTQEEERSEDRFIVSSQPKRQVDIEVRAMAPQIRDDRGGIVPEHGADQPFFRAETA